MRLYQVILSLTEKIFDKNKRKKTGSTTRWIQNVKTKWHPPKGLFAKGSAEKIAKVLWKSANGNLKTAMSRLNFYINRAGSNLNMERKRTLSQAKRILMSYKKSRPRRK